MIISRNKKLMLRIICVDLVIQCLTSDGKEIEASEIGFITFKTYISVPILQMS